jgi:glutamyl-tRNA(Gln) amidotransferase subunit D
MDIIKLFLEKFNISIGDYVKISSDDGRVLKGIIMPKHIYSKEDVLVVKLDNGYNVGIKISRISEIEKESFPKYKGGISPKLVRKGERGLPKVLILGVGGTILSRVDYRTGGVRSAVSAEEIVEILPEISEIAEISTKVIMNKYSEHMTPKDWEKISYEVYNGLKEGYDGIVILHGTDTLGYTASALSFSIQKPQVPIILVGSQRSSDRPSSDAALNLISAIYASVRLPYSGVFVAMHAYTSDDYIAIHRGTRVRKNHTSRRDAFRSIDVNPIAYVYKGKDLSLSSNDHPLIKRDKKRIPIFYPKFSNKAALIKFYPGMHPEILKSLIGLDMKALILEGTGLGHVSDSLYEVIRSLIREGIHVYMTSQCIWGRVNLNVYDTGRILRRIGVIPLENMLSETAYVKASWAIGNFDIEDLDKIMLEDIAGEIIMRSPVEDLRGGGKVE